MTGKQIPDSAIELVAKHINTRSNKNHGIPVIGHEGNIQTPQIFEIIQYKTNENGVEIGYLCVGKTIFKDKAPILFQIDKLSNKRTMVFAQSDFGKTNLLRYCFTIFNRIYFLNLGVSI